MEERRGEGGERGKRGEGGDGEEGEAEETMFCVLWCGLGVSLTYHQLPLGYSA